MFEVRVNDIQRAKIWMEMRMEIRDVDEDGEGNVVRLKLSVLGRKKVRNQGS